MNEAALARRAAIDALADRIAETAALLDATTHTLLTHIREFDELGGWARQGALSCAHWLSWRIGLAPAAAREKVRVGRALRELPLIDDALRTGELSYSKVRAMTRVATPANEAELLHIARFSTASELEKICRLYRHVTDDPAAARAAEERRWVHPRTTDDGLVRIDVLLPPEEAAILLQAIDVSAETGNRADGLVTMAEAVVRGDAPDRSPVEVLVHVDATTMQGHVEDGPGVSAEAARRLCCDAGLVPILEDAAGNTLDVGRKTRSIPSAIRRALRARDHGCQFPGCTHARYLDAHHIEHWADGGATELGNLVSLCRRHHRYVHEYGYSIAQTSAGEIRFFEPDGEPVPETWVPPAYAFDARRRSRELIARLELGPHTNAPRWVGEPPDYGLVIGLLCAADRPPPAAAA